MAFVICTKREQRDANHAPAHTHGSTLRIRSTESLTQNRWISTSWRLWDMTRSLQSLADVLAFLQQSAVTSTCDSLAAPFLTDTGYD